MNWLSFEKKYRQHVESSGCGFTNEELEICLAYQKKLFDKKLPIIFDVNHFSRLVGISPTYVLKASNSCTKFYRNFKIRKRNGDYRQISEPLPVLKEIQSWISENILTKLKPSKCSKAFFKGDSIKKNAKLHQNRRKILCVDLKDFFTTIRFPRVFSTFRRAGYSLAVSTLLASLCCKNDCLPQGSPSSPLLANLVCRKLDLRLFRFCRKFKLYYSRYADDITISGEFAPGFILNGISKIIQSEGFQINEDKTRVMNDGQRKIVTGIVVNKDLNAPRIYRRRIIQEVFFIKKYGLLSHLEFIGCNKSRYLHHLLGKINFSLHINSIDRKLIDAREFVKELMKQ